MREKGAIGIPNRSLAGLGGKGAPAARPSRRRRALSQEKQLTPRVAGPKSRSRNRSAPQKQTIKNKQEENRSEIRRTTDKMIKRSRTKRIEQIEAETNAGLPNKSASGASPGEAAHRASFSSMGWPNHETARPTGLFEPPPQARQTLGRNLSATSAHFPAAAGPCGSSLEPGFPRPSCAVFPSIRRIPAPSDRPPIRAAHAVQAKPSRLARFSRPALFEDCGGRVKTPCRARGFGPAFCARTSSCRPSPNRRRGGLARSQ